MTHLLLGTTRKCDRVRDITEVYEDGLPVLWDYYVTAFELKFRKFFSLAVKKLYDKRFNDRTMTMSTLDSWAGKTEHQKKKHKVDVMDPVHRLLFGDGKKRLIQSPLKYGALNSFFNTKEVPKLPKSERKEMRQAILDIEGRHPVCYSKH